MAGDSSESEAVESDDSSIKVAKIEEDSEEEKKLSRGKKPAKRASSSQKDS